MSIGIKAGHSKLLSEILWLLYSIVCELLMSPKKEGILGICSHLLDDQNYGDWKVHMSTLIKSLRLKVW